MVNNVKAIFEGLNDEQHQAVACINGPVLIVAGAGSGKTRVLTSRIANILAQGCEAGKILALTFTKKAASEMKERISMMVGERNARKLYMGTFHSVFIRFLREYADRIGYPQNFTIYDTSDSVSAIKACLKELQLDDKVYKPKDVLGRISMAKNNLVTAAAYKANPQVIMNDTRARKPRICDIYALYAAKCRQSGVMDFDDILLNMNILLRDFPEALKEIADRFSYIMVDEYQDTNFAQYLILKKLSQWHRNLCVVGDDSQSIYAFRGAKVENILNFKKDYPGCRTFRLERNYRSTQVIVNAANSLIAKNSNRIPKNCYAVGEEGEKIRLIRAYTEQEEAVLVTGGILDRMREEHAQYQDFAILYRTNAQSRALEESLRKRNIPYVIYSGNSFFDRAEIKDMMAYFKLVINPHDDESFKRVVNKPARGIGDTSLDALLRCARAEDLSLFRASFSDRLEEFGLKNAGIQKIREFTKMINSLSMQVHSVDAETLAKRIADDSGLYASYKADTSIEGQSRVANIEELMNSVASYIEDRDNEYLAELDADGSETQVSAESLPLVRLDEFLENISLLSSVDMEDEEDTNNKVALMTVHSSKGLEFPYVYITGMEENLFPSGGLLALPTDVEEERRLFYVAVTRAKKAVALSFTSTRMRNGKHESNPPSRFVKEIDAQYIKNPLTDSEMEAPQDSGFGRRWSPGTESTGGPRGSSYGRSSAVTYVRRGASQAAPASSAAPAQASARMVNPRPAAVKAPAGPRYDEASFRPDPAMDFAIGQKVEHLTFGPGRILDLSGDFPNIKVKVAFEDYPEPKFILLKFAKMRIVR